MLQRPSRQFYLSPGKSQLQQRSILGWYGYAPSYLIEVLTQTAIGPARLYNIGQRYSGLLHMFWIGALLPILTFFLKKKYPNNRFLNAVHWPIFFAGTGNLPPAV